MEVPEMTKMECDCKKEAVAIGGHHVLLARGPVAPSLRAGLS